MALVYTNASGRITSISATSRLMLQPYRHIIQANQKKYRKRQFLSTLNSLLSTHPALDFLDSAQ